MSRNALILFNWMIDKYRQRIANGDNIANAKLFSSPEQVQEEVFPTLTVSEVIEIYKELENIGLLIIKPAGGCPVYRAYLSKEGASYA